MIVGIALGRRALDVVIIFLADVKFAANDRLHAELGGLGDELDGAKNIAVVGHRHSGHAELVHMFAKPLDIAGAIQQGVIGMQVQVNELGHRLQLMLRWRHSNGKRERRSGQLSTERRNAGSAYAATAPPARRASGNPPRARRSLWWLPEGRGQRVEFSLYAPQRSSTTSVPRWRNSALPVCAGRGKPARWPPPLRCVLFRAAAEAPASHKHPDRLARAASVRRGSARSSRWPGQFRIADRSRTRNQNPTTSKDRISRPTTGNHNHGQGSGCS